MAKLVVPGICRFTLHATVGGEAVSNVFDMNINTIGLDDDRTDSIADQADVLWNVWASEVLPLQVDNLALVRLTWVDLDTDDGEVGEITGTGSNPLPQVGGDSGAPMPTNTSVLVRKTIAGARGRRDGLFYVPGFAEARTTDAAPNELAAVDLGVLQTAFTDLLGNINQDAGVDPPQYDSRLSVVHVTERDADGHAVAGVSSEVTALTVRARLATQRRRMNGR